VTTPRSTRRRAWHVTCCGRRSSLAIEESTPAAVNLFAVADLGSIDDAIDALEAQRELLGDAVVDTALAPLRAHRAELIERVAAEQRKLVTVLFSDLVDFTVLSQQLDAEDVRTVIDAYFSRWRQHIEANGGVVEKYIGDAVMAVFGLHAAAEHDAHQAIRAALSMRASLDELNVEVAAAHDITLEMRVGIDTGEVVTSTLGDRPGQDFVVVGDIVNRSSRLQSVAPRGGILISADTYRHVKGSFDLQTMSGLQLKGIAQPIDGYLVQCERPRGLHLDAGRGVEGVETHTVGRDLELRQLQDRFHEVVEERQWQMVTIVGDAGVGKSRLMSEFDRWLDEIHEEVWWFSGRADQSGPSLPYALLHDVFAVRFDINDSDEPSDVRWKWERGVEQAFGHSPDAVDKAHILASWLGFEIGESRTLDRVGSDSQALSGRATAHLGEYFRRLADVSPVVLLLEDLHWADEATLALINAADAVLRDCPVLVVATTRPTLLERHPHWGEGLDFHTRLPLMSLSRRDTRRLLDEILKRADHVPQALSDLVVMASEGNPFYVEELVNWFLEAAVITRDAETWHVVAERLEQAEVPATLRSVLQARLDALPIGERLALQRAAVIGRVFWDQAVESLREGGDPALLRADAPTGAALDELRGRELVYQREKSAFDHTREFLFKHALLRDVAYDGMLRKHRRAYHRLAAQWFELMAESSHRAGEYAGLIADHHAHSGDREAAARWYLVAGEQAASVHGLADARRLISQGIDLVPESATPLHFDLLLARESVLDRIGDRPAQKADLEALDSLETVVADADPGRRIRLLLTRCRWTFHHSDYQAQEEAARRALDLAQGAGLADLETEARLWMGKGMTWEGRHEEARAALDASIVGARATGQRRVITEALRYLAIVAGNMSEFSRAKALLAQVLAMHREDVDNEGESVALVQLATVLFNEGHFDEARQSLEQALPIVVASGFKYREAVVVSNLASIVVQQGELGNGRRLIERGLELCIALEDAEGVATAYTILGELERRVGDFDAAEKALRKALETMPPRGFDIVNSDALLGLAMIESVQDRHDEALADANEAIERGRQAESPMAEARALVGRGYVQLAREEVGAAHQSLRDGLDAAERLELAYLVVEAEAALARVAVLQGNLDEACEIAGRVLPTLGRPDLVGAIQPAEIYRSCRQVLVDCGDPRADEAADAARAYLESSAARIDDDELRESFLQRVPANVELAQPTGVRAG
jgi:class 3 adenylate cyclase/tetratricopeptide (TPR) repeat protein